MMGLAVGGRKENQRKIRKAGKKNQPGSTNIGDVATNPQIPVVDGSRSRIRSREVLWGDSHEGTAGSSAVN